MALDEVTTQDEELLNTEAELEEDHNEPDNTDSDTGDSDDTPDEQPETETLDEDDKLTEDQISAMSDDEFKEFIESGKVPGKKDTSKEEDKPLVKVISKPSKDSVEAIKQVKSSTIPEKMTKDIPQDKNVDYKSIYNSIFKSFKANGKEITPRSVEDVIQLMQMGANYTKKMQLMAPMKKAVETLNRAEIGEEDLNFLIDVHKGEKEAIKKLLEKHKVDPMELDMESTNYVPKNNIVSDSDVEYSMVLDEIQDSLPKIQEIMSKTWDSKSKEALLKDPGLMKALHEEIQYGRFDEVQSRLEIEKTFGRYKGVSDLNAYIDLVKKMTTEQSKTVKTNPIPVKKETVPSKPVPDKTKAAPIRSKPAKQGTTLSVKDIFSMPEDEFNKLSMRDLV